MATVIVKQTSDYSKFEMHEHNRLLLKGGEFTPRKDLIESMKKNGFRPSQPISVVILTKDKYKIFDGHNRFVTGKYLGIPICYQVFPKEFEVTPLEYSQGQKAWSMQDIVSVLSTTNEDYSEVMAYAKRTGIPVACCFSVFQGESAGSGNAQVRAKNGVFHINDRVRSAQLEQIVNALKAVCDFATTKNFIVAISKLLFVDCFHVPKIIERIQTHPELIKKCRTADDYIELLDLIYNRNKKGERVNLKEEVKKIMRERRLY